ncbi:MAG: DeoR family transcriptional regulator [Austwickia sp.]|nr:DeoR family transcriptional regulator [Austwickia sp.]
MVASASLMPRPLCNTSEATIRRDFGRLAEAQLVTRTHGGAVATAMASYASPVATIVTPLNP